MLLTFIKSPPSSELDAAALCRTKAKAAQPESRPKKVGYRSMQAMVARRYDKGQPIRENQLILYLIGP